MAKSDKTETPAESTTGQGSTTATKPQKKPASKTDKKNKKLPPFNVILLDDNDHSYDYVIEMLRSLFAHSEEKAYEMAKEVDKSGRVIVFTTHRELAELKRDQIHAWGTDVRVATCKGSMSATIEAAN